MATPDLQSRLADLFPQAWRDAARRVPRHAFLPDTIWLEDGNGPQPLHRGDTPDRWMELAYANRPLVTQLDDGNGSGDGYITSSASQPSIVGQMLDAADIRPGQRVMEIGTGTGWNAALIAAMIGPGNTVTVEIDEVLAQQARRILTEQGWPVQVIAGDGTLGWVDGSPYDRVLSTAAVQQVPTAWVAQTRPGGRVLTPWGTTFHNGVLASLDVGDDGTASGRFHGDAAFMWLRSQRRPRAVVEDIVNEAATTDSTTSLHPYYVLGDDASFAVGLRLRPGMSPVVVFDDDVEGSPFYTVYLLAPGSGSWASWRVEPGQREYRVRQYGPRRLMDEVADSYDWWVMEGRPRMGDFGLSVAPGGQRVWLRSPQNRVDRASTEPLRT